MKKLVFCIFIFSRFTVHSQQAVVFCPPGAEWKYLYYTPLMNQHTYPKVKYLFDSLLNGETVKVLQAQVFFTADNALCSQLLYLKQNGDTIFMKSCNTQNTWVILYNFAAAIGHQWLTKITDYYNPPGVSITHTITVTGTSTVNINGKNLKRLSVKSCYPANGIPVCHTATITERIGTLYFLFDYHKYIHDTDYDTYADFLCYHDDDFSPTSFSPLGCNYTYNVGIQKNRLGEEFSVYPNPAANCITVEVPVANTYDLQITNSLGQVYPFTVLVNQKTAVDLSSLHAGIYFLHVSDHGRLLASQKIIKE